MDYTITVADKVMTVQDNHTNRVLLQGPYKELFLSSLKLNYENIGKSVQVIMENEE